MIFANSLSGFKAFLGEAADECYDFGHALAFVACFLLPALARRSVSAAARCVCSDVRHAGNLLRFLGGSASPDALLAAAQHRLLELEREQQRRLHVLVLDSTQHTQQGEHADNTFSRGNSKPRQKNSSRKQKKVHKKSCHTFVFALLLCPCGTRVPFWLPFHTQEYCKLRNWKHQTQADLAAQLIGNLPLAKDVPLAVVGDTAFEAVQIRKACKKRKAHWVVPINPERVLAGATAPRPKVLSLCQSLKAEDFRVVSFRLDEGPLAPLARVSPSRVRSSKHQRVYWVNKRIAEVHNVGQVVLLFSNKTDPSTARKVVVQKVLMSNALKASALRLLHWYALRWQVEQFFKECKSSLGMCQYRSGKFRRVQGWVSLSVLAFCYLEWFRAERLGGASEKERPYWLSARVHALRQQLRKEVEKADIQGLLHLAASEGIDAVTALLDAAYDDPARLALP
jgi:hypothetical protein